MVEQTKEKEIKDQLGEFMKHVRGPPWSWYITTKEKKEKENKENKENREELIL